MNKRELNLKIDDDTKVINRCEDAILNINTILNSLKLLKKATRKMYPDNEATDEFAEVILATTADIMAMKTEIEEVASDTADEMNKLIRERRTLEDGVQE